MSKNDFYPMAKLEILTKIKIDCERAGDCKEASMGLSCDECKAEAKEKLVRIRSGDMSEACIASELKNWE